MDKFKISSDFLKGERAKKTIESIAYLLTRHYDPSLAEDVVKSLILGLDGGPEQYERYALSLIKNLRDNKIVVNREELKANIRAFIEDAAGSWISYSQLDKELGIVSPKDMNYRRQVIYKFIQEGIVEKDPKKDGLIRKAPDTLAESDWQNVKTDNIFPLRLPFALETMVHIYPKNLVIVAGSPNAGKTAFLLSTVELNMNDKEIYYFSSEMSPEEMQIRASKFDTPFKKWKVHFIETASNFVNQLRPDDINIIDYFEIGDNFYAISDAFRQIFDKLNKGIAIIALQKKFGASLGRGAEFGMEKARLYLTIDNGELVIQKAKNWATKDNPNHKKIRFKLVDGAKFIQINIEDRIPF